MTHEKNSLGQKKVQIVFQARPIFFVLLIHHVKQIQSLNSFDKLEPSQIIKAKLKL